LDDLMVSDRTASILWRLSVVTFLCFGQSVAGRAEGQANVMTSAPELVVAFGREGDAPGEFRGPFGVAIGPDGLIYVADDLGHRIQVFDRAGRLQRALGRHGTGPGELAWVDSVAVDLNGDLYVADTGNNRVQVWSGSGVFLRQFGRHWWRPWSTLRNPRHVRIGPDALI